MSDHFEYVCICKSWKSFRIDLEIAWKVPEYELWIVYKPYFDLYVKIFLPLIKQKHVRVWNETLSFLCSDDWEKKTSLFPANQVKYWRKYDDPEPGANRIFVPASVNQTRLENMLPDSHYLIEVRAFNGAGFGPPGEHCEMFTKRARKSDSSINNDVQPVKSGAQLMVLFCPQHRQNLPGCGATSAGQESGCTCGGITSHTTGLAISPSHCTIRWVCEAWKQPWKCAF